MERVDGHEHIFKQGEPYQCAGDAKGHIDDVVVGGVDGGEPYAEGDYPEEQAHPVGGAGAQGVDERHEGVGRM